MKIAFKNFLTTLRRYKAASVLNIVGLTLAFTAFYIILVQVWWELGYNRRLPDAERVYVVEHPDWYEPGRYSAWLNRPVCERAIASSPGIEAGGCMSGGFGNGEVWLRNASGAGYDKFTASMGQMSVSFVDVFAFRSLEGDVHDLKRPRSVIVSRSTADRLGVGVGDLMWLETDAPSAENASEVVAVFEDFPSNSLLADCHVAMDLGTESLDDASEWSYTYFVKLRPGADPAAFEEHYLQVFRELGRERAEELAAAGRTEKDDGVDPAIRLSPVTGLYFQTDTEVPSQQGSIVTTYTLLGIAVLVIVLAFINFVNFFFALVPVRIRTVNTFKVFGAPASSLRFSFIFEAFGLVLLSLLAGWYLAFAVQGTEFASYISASLALSENLPVVAMVVAVAFCMALAASLYPAWYITSFAPAMVVRGSFAGTRGGRRLRTLLLGIQFFISAGLIIATMFIRLQHDFMMRYDMGFDKHNLIAVRAESMRGNYESLRGKLLADPRIADVTGASSRMVSVNRMGWGRSFKGEQVAFQTYVVQWNFLRMMGIPVTEGRDFTEYDHHKELGTLIFNETARRKFGMQVGDRINGFVSDDEQIVGFCTDFNFRPLQYDIMPFAFYILPEPIDRRGWHAPVCIYVRTVEGADVGAVTEYIRRCITQIDPRTEAGDIRILTFDEELGREYGKERKLTAIVGLFTLLSVAIALMGVFGIVLFETQHRRREIAVRKVMGASTAEILAMFNRRYVALVAVCFVAAAPVAGGIVGRWLSSFAYHTSLKWWVFAAALAVVLAVVVLTVSVRSWHAANENPADSVKSE